MNIYLNHIYLVLSDKTYRSITGSDFLRTAFPGMERRTTYTETGESWFGTYFYGFDNYIEFFSETAGHWQPGAARGWGGLAFSTDEPGGADFVQQRLREALGYEPTRSLRRFQDGKNWFYHVRLAEQLGQESFDAWVMEYHPDVFAQRGLPVGPNGELSRQAYLSPFNTPRKPGPGSPAALVRQPVFKRLIGAEVCLLPEAAQKLARILHLLGYALEERPDHFCLSAHGFTFRLFPNPAGSPAGCYTIRALTLQMSRPSVAPATFVFSKGSRLVLNDDLTAVWSFA